MADDELTRGAIQDAVGELGWRLVLREIRCEVRVQTLADAARAVSLAVAACGAAGQRHLSADVRRDRVVLAMVSADAHRVTPHDLDLARSVTDALSRRGLVTTPGGERGHPVQLLELAIDALDIPAVRPFWAAVTGFVDDPGDSPPNGLLDPLGQAPAIWFQQMDEPRPQRNRIHLDVSVPHDDAVARVAAVVAAGGKVVDDASAPAFWVLADAEGNEACVTTWQGRD